MNKRILFVDDEPMILQGIQHSLRGMRAEWEVALANSGAEALETMAQAPFDVVITDMRMPGMDGAQLLDLVKVKFPRTVRIILSGQSDRETILRSVGPSHQYLSKPCDLDELKRCPVVQPPEGYTGAHFDNPAVQSVEVDRCLPTRRGPVGRAEGCVVREGRIKVSHRHADVERVGLIEGTFAHQRSPNQGS